LTLPAITFGGMTFTDVGYSLQFLILGSIFVVAGQVTMLAVAMRVGATSDGFRSLRDTFS
jgi:hypothetical protein